VPRMSTPRTQYARSGDAQLAYQVIGAGSRDIVLAFDWGSHLEEVWEQPLIREFVSGLTRFGRVIWFDIRGVGLSRGGLDATIPVEAWVEDVGAVMAAAGSVRATLMAHGHAAQLALLFAATHPDRTTSLVILNGFARYTRTDDYPAGMPPKVQESLLHTIETQWGTGTLVRVLAPTVAGLPGVDDWWGRVERYTASPTTAVARMRAVFELDVRNVLPLVEAPTLVVTSRDNWFVRAEHGRYLAGHVAGARLLERDSPDYWPLPEEDLLGAIEEFITGTRTTGGDADRVLATVLFVDVADSTRRAVELGDRRWSSLRNEFEQTVRRTLGSYRGELVNTAGDGVLATFDGPARAIRSAAEIRDAVRQTGLEVRSGLHAGEVTRSPGDVAGITVHVAARVCALAVPGEVLVTRTVRDLVAGSGIRFEERGEHELKGVPDSWALYAATG
jgi:class 3 adenylate cyclase